MIFKNISFSNHQMDSKTVIASFQSMSNSELDEVQKSLSELIKMNKRYRLYLVDNNEDKQYYCEDEEEKELFSAKTVPELFT